MTQLLSSFDIRKLPVHFGACGIAFGFQSCHLPLQSFNITNPPPQTIALENAQFNLSHIKPTGVFGRVGKPELASYPARFLGWISFVQRSGTVRIEIVIDQFDPFRFRIAFIDQPFENGRVITGGAALSYDQMAKTGQGLQNNEQIGRATPLVLVIYSFDLTGCTS